MHNKARKGMIVISDVDGVHTRPEDGALITACPSLELGTLFSLCEDGGLRTLRLRSIDEKEQGKQELVIGGFLGSEVMEFYRFHTPDGQAVQNLLGQGCRTIIVSGREAAPVQDRFGSRLYHEDSQGVHRPEVFLGVKDKLVWFMTLDIDPREVIFITDGHQDVPLMKHINHGGGITIAPSDAEELAKKAADVCTSKGGGEGAFAELVDAYLHAVTVT